ncbi:ATP-binding cassette domain-containing protein [Actinophytocola sp.]|uniref:ATP-binding cassette domain-containing protein n=1 Tax=Actinophytocola sp. TaxID=1872138 RepID=UPI0038999908
MDLAVLAEGLHKRYGTVDALRGVDIAIPAGSVFALLGPNGAGKTTAVRILSTLLAPDAGRAVVAGVDVVAAPERVRERIGLAGQHVAVDPLLTARENLRLVGRLHRLGRRGAAARATRLVHDFGLEHAADRPSRTFSGGMRRRLDLALSLVVSPAVLFLDEPTTGLDPISRHALWDMIRAQVADGVTVLLTTQYLEETERLADRVAVIDTGVVIAEGTIDELKRRTGGERVQVALAPEADLGAAADAVDNTGVGRLTLEPDRHGFSVAPDAGLLDAISAITAALRATGAEVVDFAVRRPSMDDVFLSLTGHESRAKGTV